MDRQRRADPMTSGAGSSVQSPALVALDVVDRLLQEAGYAEDSSTRHNLAIARSYVADQQTLWRRVDHIEKWTERELWSFLRSVLSQGMAIQMDAAAGKYQRSEEVSIRLDAAARERRDQMQAELGRTLP